jgi:hypothetical protein
MQSDKERAGFTHSCASQQAAAGICWQFGLRATNHGNDLYLAAMRQARAQREHQLSTLCDSSVGHDGKAGKQELTVCTSAELIAAAAAEQAKIFFHSGAPVQRPMFDFGSDALHITLCAGTRMSWRQLAGLSSSH